MLKLSARAKKELKSISKIEDKQLVLDALKEIKEDPLLGKELAREFSKQFSFRVKIYRIIYKINKKDKIVTILSAGHRATIYN